MADGARVAIADIDFERAQNAAAEIGDGAVAVAMDVTSEASIEAAVDATCDAFGGIDILVNNAAVFTAAPITEITRADYDQVFAINVAGTLFTMQAVARRMMVEVGCRRRRVRCGQRAATWYPAAAVMESADARRPAAVGRARDGAAAARPSQAADSSRRLLPRHARAAAPTAAA